MLTTPCVRPYRNMPRSNLLRVAHSEWAELGLEALAGSKAQCLNYCSIPGGTAPSETSNGAQGRIFLKTAEDRHPGSGERRDEQMGSRLD